MKNLFCKRLAACLCMKQSPSPTIEPPLISRNAWNFDVINNNADRQKLLKRMCHMMEMRVRKEEQQRYEDDKENEIKNDWMLAAAVLDRICAIAVTVFFVVGTVVFFVLFAHHH